MDPTFVPTTVDMLKQIIHQTKPPKRLIEEDVFSEIKKFQDCSCPVSEEDRSVILKKIFDSQDLNADEVYPGIFIGNGRAAQNIEYLKSLGITSVLNCAQGTGYDQINTNDEFYKGSGIAFLGLNMTDNVATDITQYTEEAINFIEASLQNAGKILVHCFMGMSRSAAIVGFYLMSRKNFSAQEALKAMREKRDIYPNDAFLQQMCDMENKIKNPQ